MVCCGQKTCILSLVLDDRRYRFRLPFLCLLRPPWTFSCPHARQQETWLHPQTFFSSWTPKTRRRNTNQQPKKTTLLFYFSFTRDVSIYLRLVEGEEEVKAGQQSPGLIGQHGVSLVGTLNNQQKSIHLFFVG